MSVRGFVTALARGARGREAAKALILPEFWGTGKSPVTPIEMHASGTPPLTLTASAGKPLKAWSVELSPYQEGSGDPSPDNVRPIHGTDKVTVWTTREEKWHKLKDVVNTGRANEVYPVGELIDDTWSPTSGTSYDTPWRVMHHFPNGDMALNWDYAFPTGITFDAPEAIYYAPAGGLPAGQYYISIGTSYGTGWVTTKHINFTLTSAMDEGDQLYIECSTNNANDPTAGATWKVFAQGSTTAKQTGTTSDSDTGTSLGTIGATNAHKPEGQLNAISRVVYGYGRWSQSAIRQWLNSTAAANAWWTPQNPWDRPPSQHSSVRGFLAGLAQELQDILVPVDVVTALNTQEGFAENTETTQDKIFLPSLEEMYITPQLADVEGVDWDYNKALATEAGLTGRFAQYSTYEILKKYNVSAKTSAVGVWLRSCNRGYANTAWYVINSGYVNSTHAYNAYRGCPACIIKKSSTPSGYATDITLSSTVYTGTVGSEGGESRWADVDMGSRSWSYNSTYAFFTCKIDTLTANNNANILATCYKTTTGKSDANMASADNNTINHAGVWLKVKDTAYTDAALFKTAVTGQHLCYELATPTEFAITAPTIPTPSGSASAWATAEDGTVDSMSADYFAKVATEYDTVTGTAPITLSDAVPAKLKLLQTSIDPVQNLNGYDNPWPAGGGKNLCEPYVDKASSNDVDFAVENQCITVSGTATGASFSWSGHQSYAECSIKLPAGTYTFSSNAVPGSSQAEGYVVFSGYTENGTAISNIILAGSILTRTATFSEDVGIYYGFYVANGVSVNITAKIQIETGSSATSWTPYSNICPITGHTGATGYINSTTSTTGATTIPVTWTDAGTVYGGTIDFVSGALTVTHACVDASTLTWSQSSSAVTRFNGTLTTRALGSGCDVVCSHLASATSFPGATKNAIYINTGIQIVANVASFTTLAEWNALVADNMEIVYALATPLIYQLDPATINTIRYNNYAWADCGNTMTATYKKVKDE